MENSVFSNEIVEFRIPTILYEKIKSIARSQDISESAVLCHFLSFGFVSLDFFNN